MAQGGSSSTNPLLLHPLLTLKNAFNPDEKIPFRQRLTTPRVPDPQIDVSRSFFDQLTEEEKNHSFTSSSGSEGTITLEYRILGLTWHTSGIRNACTLDSFLSGFVRWVRLSRANLLRKMFYPDKVGIALFNIAKRAIQEGNAIDSEWVKDQWLTAILPDGYTKPFYAQGLEDASVFQHLIQHSGLNFKVSCKCGIQYLWSAVYQMWETTNLALLPMEITGFTRSYKNIAKCGTCNEKREYLGVTPFPNNWLFIINFDGLPNPGNPFFSEFPKKIRFPAPNRSNYYLGIISYSLPSDGNPDGYGHQVSVHLIRGIWYVHDGVESPAFRRCQSQKWLNLKGAFVRSAVYFRHHKDEICYTSEPEFGDDSSDSTETTSLSSDSTSPEGAAAKKKKMTNPKPGTSHKSSKGPPRDPDQPGTSKN